MKNENKSFVDILKFLYRLTNYAVAAFFLFSALLTLLFILGNYRNFDDTVQELILKCLSISVILLDFYSFFAFIETILVIIFRKFKPIYIFLLILYFLIILFGVTVFGFSGIVENLSNGIALGFIHN